MVNQDLLSLINVNSNACRFTSNELIACKYLESQRKCILSTDQDRCNTVGINETACKKLNCNWSYDRN